jgi:hypothetical protein
MIQGFAAGILLNNNSKKKYTGLLLTHFTEFKVANASSSVDWFDWI